MAADCGFELKNRGVAIFRSRRLSTNQPKKLRKTGGPQGGTRVEVKIFIAANVTSGGQSILAKKKSERDRVGNTLGGKSAVKEIFFYGQCPYMATT